jgi:transcription elongation factor Elf1
MREYVDSQYASMLAGQLPLFKIKNRAPFKANFRCVICNDSQKSATKTRGWILENPKNGSFHYYCFNCGATHSFGNFLKTYYPLMYQDYVADKYLNNNANTDKKEEIFPENKKPIFNKNPLLKIKKISQLSHDHPVKNYIEKRQIPPNQHYRLYYAPKFMTWINGIIPDKFPSITKDEPRLVIPFFSKEGRLFGVSARGFSPSGLRYITIMFDDRPKIFGLDKVDFNKHYFVTEGAIDSMFLSNSVAMVGADIKTEGLVNLDNAIYVFDAEPRNAEICKRMEKIIRSGYRICIWPSNVPGKDINEMYLKGVKNIESTILSNSYKGLEALLKYQAWKKV